MNARAEELRSAVLALPEGDRAELVVDLLDSLDDRPVEGDRDTLDRVWSEEIARRAAQIDGGQVRTDSWDDVLRRIARARRDR